MKTLIVYYSFTGNNKALAERLQARPGRDILQLMERGKRSGLSILLDRVFRRTPRLETYALDTSQVRPSRGSAHSGVNRIETSLVKAGLKS